MTRTRNIKRRITAEKKRQDEEEKARLEAEKRRQDEEEKVRLEAQKRRQDKEEKKRALKKKILEEERKQKRTEQDKRTRTWDARFRPQIGHTILYVERGREDGRFYETQFVGLVTYSKLYRDGTLDFEIRTKNYSNHRNERCETPHQRVREEDEGRTQYLFFTEKDLTSTRTESVCYTDYFVRHLKHDEDYVRLLTKTYYTARHNMVFPEKSCYHGSRCNNKKVGHLINFRH